MSDSAIEADAVVGIKSSSLRRAVSGRGPTAPVEAPDAAEGGAGGVGGGGVGGGGVGSGPGSERPPPGIHVARGSMSSALRREVAAPTPPPEGSDRLPCHVTLGGGASWRRTPFVGTNGSSSSQRRRHSSSPRHAAAPPPSARRRGTPNPRRLRRSNRRARRSSSQRTMPMTARPFPHAPMRAPRTSFPKSPPRSRGVRQANRRSPGRQADS